MLTDADADVGDTRVELLPAVADTRADGEDVDPTMVLADAGMEDATAELLAAVEKACTDGEDVDPTLVLADAAMGAKRTELPAAVENACIDGEVVDPTLVLIDAARSELLAIVDDALIYGEVVEPAEVLLDVGADEGDPRLEPVATVDDICRDTGGIELALVLTSGGLPDCEKVGAGDAELAPVCKEAEPKVADPEGAEKLAPRLDVV